MKSYNNFISESLEERTSNSFYNWYITYVDRTFATLKPKENEYNYQTLLNSWLIYKPYFNNKDISQYKTFDDFLSALKLAKQKYYSKLKNVEEDKDYKIIYEDENLKIIVPLTISGSCKYGYNTKWCTAMMERPEHFTWHKTSGELYRFIFKNDLKYSLHWANNDRREFRNQEDKPVETIYK